jgi:hypothetical protein
MLTLRQKSGIIALWWQARRLVQAQKGKNHDQ